jgi:hypothetical protein
MTVMEPTGTCTVPVQFIKELAVAAPRIASKPKSIKIKHQVAENKNQAHHRYQDHNSM